MDPSIKPTTSGRHKKTASFHRRRGVELSNPGQITEVTNENKKLTDKPIYAGMLIQIENILGVAIVYCVIPNDDGPDIIGCELEAELGTCNGIYKGKRYFKSPDNCAVFVPKTQCMRILPLKAPPRFISRSHNLHNGDVVMISKDIGVGIVRHASTHTIGCALNAPVGDSDGYHDQHRYFQVPQKHSVFVEPETLKKIEAEDLLKN
eukprot:UN34291